MEYFHKIAKVIPLYKKGLKTMLDNYRPISILPAISKAFENILYDQLWLSIQLWLYAVFAKPGNSPPSQRRLGHLRLRALAAAGANFLRVSQREQGSGDGNDA